MNNAINAINATATAWTIHRDEWDEDGIKIFPTAEESAALIKWHGDGRIIEMRDLGQPTFSEFGESKADAFQAALAALERATA